MTAIPVSDTNLLTPADYAKVRMELFEKTGTGNYKVRYEAAQTFLQLAADIAIGGAHVTFNTLGKIQPMIEALQNAGNIASAIEFDVQNQTGELIPRGTVVYPDVTTVIGLADAYDKSKSRVIAVLKDDLADGASGKAVKLGTVINVNTAGFLAGQVVYLGRGGQYSTTAPTDGGFICIVGIVDVVSATVGTISVDTHISPNTVEVTDTNGFPADQRTKTTLSFNDATRELSISPDEDSFHYYQTGDKFSKTATQTVAIADVTGAHIQYFDGATLKTITNPTAAQAGEIILTKAIVSYVYWNATYAKSIIVQDERHGMMQPIVHEYLHKRFGAFYLSGFALENIVIGNGSLDSHAQFGISSGSIQDEDISHDLTAVPSTEGMPILYRDGSAGAFNLATNAGFNFTVGANARPQYNYYDGATWSLLEVDSGDFFNIHQFANGSIGLKPFTVVGTATYANAALATAGQADELSTILGTLPLPEFVLPSSVIIEVKTPFNNSVNARVVQNSDGLDYTNWTKTDLSSGSPPSNHDLMAGLKTAGVGVQWGHVDDALYTKILNNSALNKLDGVAPPTVDNDVDEGYSVFSFWMDITNSKAYICFDATDGAAVWVDITAEGGSGGGGGHIWYENGTIVESTARAKLNILNNGSRPSVVDNAANDSIDYKQYFENGLDVDPTGKQAGDAITVNSSNDGVDFTPTAPDQRTLTDQQPNVSADGVMSVIIPQGYQVTDVYLENITANAITGLTIEETTNNVDLVTEDVGANSLVICVIDNAIFSLTNDHALQIAATWNGGVVNIYYRMEQKI